jgi:hypothetical protein
MNTTATYPDELWSGINYWWLLLVPILLVPLRRSILLGWPKAGTMLLALFLALQTFLGHGFSQNQNLTFLSPNVCHAISFLVQVGTLTSLYALLLNLLVSRFDSETPAASPTGCDIPTLHPWSMFSFPFCCSVILVCWLPYVIICLPGTPWYDSISQLMQFMGFSSLSNHHPILTTFLQGMCFSAGSKIAGANGGFLAMLVAQVAILVASFSYCLTWLRRFGLSNRGMYAALGFYALDPVFPIFSTWLVKDQVSNAIAMLFILQVIVVLWSCTNPNTSKFGSWHASLLIGLLTCFLRNDSIIIVVPTLICLALTQRGVERYRTCAIAVSIAVGFLLVTSLAFPLAGISRTSNKEMLSIPLQQLARCAKEYPDDLDNADVQYLETSFSTSIDGLGRLYSPGISDPVKSAFSAGKAGGLMAFMKTWLNMGIRHPDSYFAATIAGSIGYWYPFGTGSTEFNQAISNTLVPDKMQQGWSRTPYDEGSSFFPVEKGCLRSAMLQMAHIPILCLLISPALIIWLDIIVCLISIHRKSAGGILLVPYLLHWLVCIASPLNGSIRYSLLFFFTLPLAIACIRAFQSPGLQNDSVTPD